MSGVYTDLHGGLPYWVERSRAVIPWRFAFLVIGGVVEPGDVESERVGNTLVIRPVAAHSLVGVVDRFAAFPAGFMAEGREIHDENERAW